MYRRAYLAGWSPAGAWRVASSSSGGEVFIDRTPKEVTLDKSHPQPHGGPEHPGVSLLESDPSSAVAYREQTTFLL